MDFIRQSFQVNFQYDVYFTLNLFHESNATLRKFFEAKTGTSHHQKILFVVDKGVADHHPALQDNIKRYFGETSAINLIPEIIISPGGESAKNTTALFDKVVKAVNDYGIDRHSYIAAIGGGSLLDVTGYAAAVSHRGIRHIRVPTTVLSQNDSGVGVKNGINYFNKKNFIGTFAPPAAVFNDFHFLTTLSLEDWCAGISEAIKVALIKDQQFFEWLEQNAILLANRDMPAMQYLIRRCAALHLEHIAGKDPFETGSSRPLDFGHWSAHKLEQLSRFTIRHGEAVAIGIALDSAYSHIAGKLTEEELKRILTLITQCKLPLTHELLTERESIVLVNGLSEFREHLGGQLTIMLLSRIGQGEETNEMDPQLIMKSNEWIADYSNKINSSKSKKS